MRIKRGNTHSYSRLYNYFFPMGVSTLRKYDCPENEAQDICSHFWIEEVWVKLTRGDARKIRRFRAYYFKSLRNAWAKRAKKLQKIQSLTKLEEYAKDEEIGVLFTRVERMKKSLAKLSEKCREILEESYYYFDKQSLQEVARDLGLRNADTAKSTKSRCLKRLREYYENGDLTGNY